MTYGARASTLVILSALAWLAGSSAPTAQGGPTSSLAGIGLPLPKLGRCKHSAPPVLPRRWRAVAMMAPFSTAQIDVGEFVYDATLGAMRVTVYGLQSGAADLLITKNESYVLSGPHAAPTGCARLGRSYVFPSTQWLSDKAQCAGVAPVLETPAEWWRTPAPGKAAHWFWFNSKTRRPWRIMMNSRSRVPAVIGEYAMAHFSSFEALARTDLSRLRNFCRTQATDNPSGTVSSARAAMRQRPNPAAEAERRARLRSLIPGLSYEACARVKTHPWPRRFRATAIMIATPFDQGPFPSEIFYDWDGAKAQLTRLRDPANPSSPAAIDGLLRRGIGYDIRRKMSGALSCEPVYPGIVRPDWLTSKGCACKGVLSNTPGLAPKQGVQIRVCPVGSARGFWVWYAGDGRPITIYATAISPQGLVLADYFGWAPGRANARGTLDVPPACRAAERNVLLSLFKYRAMRRNFATGCSACHTMDAP